MKAIPFSERTTGMPWTFFLTPSVSLFLSLSLFHLSLLFCLFLVSLSSWTGAGFTLGSGRKQDVDGFLSCVAAFVLFQVVKGTFHNVFHKWGIVWGWYGVTENDTNIRPSIQQKRKKRKKWWSEVNNADLSARISKVESDMLCKEG